MVVAPISLISPRAIAGFNISAAPLSPPRSPDTSVCISSIKSITFSCSLTKSRIALNLSSNSPWYLAPATTAAISSEKILFPLRGRGTFPLAILIASPSTTALFPVPGSPISKGLFFCLLESVLIIRSVSFSLPITGSSRPFSARSVKSIP